MGPMCWHRGRPRRKIWVCRHCGVAVEICSCDTSYRKPDPECIACQGSGWVAIVRGRIAEFREYLELDPDPKPRARPRVEVDW